MWDDPNYVLENPYLKINSWKDVVELFFVPNVQANYHPITLLSLAIDYSIDGPNPTVFHTTNLFFHLANAILVYIFVFRLFKEKKVAFFASLLFAIHPMHVESFAWVSERKDVIYVFFFLIALLQYLSYQKRGNRFNYLACLFFFLLSVLSKGMAVVFPIILLLVDFLRFRKFNIKVLLEKIPFFILSLIFGIIVIKVQGSSGAISNIADSPFIQTFLVPIYGLFSYLFKFILPLNLSALHPYQMILDGKIPNNIAMAALPLLVLTAVIVKKFRRNRPVVFGFLFFIAAIFPVLQFMSVGSAIISERYTYLSYIGLFISFGLILNDIYLKQKPNSKIGLKIMLVIYIGFLCFQTNSRVKVWNDDESLWSDVIETYPDDYFAYMKRGSFRAKNGNSDAALADLNTSISIFQNDYYSFNNRGMIYLSKRNYELAEKDFSKAIQIDSTLYEAHLNRGLIYLNTKNYQLAEKDFKKSASLAPSNVLCFLNQALLYERMDSSSLALENFNKVLKLSPRNLEVFKYRGLLFLKNAMYENALQDFNQFLELSNEHPEGFYLKAKALLFLNRKKEARAFAQKAHSMGYALSEEELKPFYN